MSKVSKIITKHIKSSHYPDKPLDVKGLTNDLSVVKVVNDMNLLPKDEKNAMGRDMTDADEHFLKDHIGFMRKLTQTDLLYLMHTFMGFRDVSPDIQYHKDLAYFYDRDYMRMVVLLPRWHFKTTFGAGYIVRNLLQNHNNTWLVESATDENAEEIFGLVQTGLVTDAMRLIWGDLKVNPRKPRWSTKSLNISMREDFTNRAPSVYWRGIHSEVTGQHPDNALFDDISAETNCETPEQRRKIKDRYDRKILIVKKIILNNATRWHFDDVIGHILDKNKDKTENDAFRYHLFKRDVYDKTGDVLFPEKYPKSWVESMRRELGSYLFATQMMNNPIPEEDQIFKPEWVEPYYYNSLDDIKHLFKEMNFYLTVDPGSTDKKSGDFTAIVVCGVTPMYDIYVVEYVRKRASIGEITEDIFRLVKKWNVQTVGIEQGAYEKIYKKDLKYLQRVKNIFFSLRKLRYGQQPGSRSRAKQDRIRSLQPLFENGCIHIGKWMTDLQDEVIFYDAYKFDDGVDALAYQRQLIKLPRHKEEKKEKDWRQRWLERKRKGRGGGSFRAYVNSEAVR